jgi:hypothetical protein
MTRIEFLRQFLGALGAESVAINAERAESIDGRVFFENDPTASYFDPDDDQSQEFIWHRSEHNVPGYVACAIATLLKNKQLLDVDKIKVTRDALYAYYTAEYGDIPYKEFISGLEELLRVEVDMVDDGRETDIFFIHE